MSDTMLHGILQMPPRLWSNDAIDIAQRHGRYLEASERIMELERERDEARRELQVVLDLMAVRRMNNGALVYDLKEHILSLERKLNEAKQMVDQLKLERMREEVTSQQDPVAPVCVYCREALKKIKQEETK